MATAAADNKAIVPPDATTQVSYSGTPRGPDGTAWPDDYNRDLANPVRRMEIFEEMGNDDAVQTGILARRQEICAANWQLSTEDTTPLGQEILEFTEDNVYPVLDSILRLLGAGGMQYGFGALETVLQWSDRPIVSSITRGKVARATRNGEQRIYIRKLAHLRQTSVNAFKIAGPNDPSGQLPGDLQAIEQHPFDGVSFRQRYVPADKVLLWVYNKQGDDFFGVPPTRACYKAWGSKQQIERLNLLHLDKFAVGTPVAEEGEGWGPAERTRLATFLQGWRSGAHNYIIHPQGGTITIQSDDGKTTMSMLEWIKYYNLAVAKTFLTQMTELGSTETGARALGEVFYSQMGGIVQADCEDIANLLNNELIVPLVRYNFGEQEFYPTFAPSQRVRAGTGVATVIAQLIGAKVIHPRPEDEAYLRDIFEMPPVDVKTLKSEQDARDATAQKIADAATASTNTDAAGGAPNADGGQASAPATPPVRIAAHHDHAPRFSLASTIADGAPEPATNYETSYRTPEFSAWEHGILRPDVLSQDLDLQSSRVTSEAQDVLRAIDEDLTRQVESLAAKGAAALSAGIKGIAVPDRLRKQLRSVLLGAAQRARDYGAKAVMNEIERQIGPSAIGPQRTPMMGFFGAIVSKLRTLAVGDAKTPADFHLEAEVDRAVEDEIDRREGSARGAGLTALAQAAGAAADVLSTVASTAAKASLVGLSPGRTQDNVSGVVNTGFGIGRSETAQEIASGGGGAGDSGFRDSGGNPIGIVAKVYSAVMDFGTCDECAKWDGAEFPIDYPEDYTGVQAPNPRCAGGYARCRCVFVYITDKEAVPLVPASKGPQPIRRAA
jgi:hypothetical protein